MFKTGYNSECSSRISDSGNTIYSLSIFLCLIILLVGSCKNSINEEKGEQLVGYIMSDIQLIEANFLTCFSHIEENSIGTKLCENEIAKIRLLHEKTKSNLLTLANLRNKGMLSNDDYNSFIDRIDEELKGVRDLNHQLKEKGISIGLN